MPQTLRKPLEAEITRISFQNESEGDGDEIVCRPQETWGSQANWTVGVVDLKKLKNKFSIQPSHLLDLYCSVYDKSSDWVLPQQLDWVLPPEGLSVELVDWSKLSGSILGGLLEVEHHGFNVVGDVSLEAEFKELASQWYDDTRNISSAEQIVLHPAYQKIIGMGKDALPFVFRELKKTRGHWIWALAMILREDKAKPGMKFREAVDAWLAWGERNGYISCPHKT
jgi:hypothetical protein